MEDFVVITFFQMTIFYSMCLYYATKASGLLKNRKPFIAALSFLYTIGVLLQVFLGVWSSMMIGDNVIDRDNMCLTWQFYCYDLCSLLILTMFIGAYCNIRARIIQLPRETDLDQLILKY